MITALSFNKIVSIGFGESGTFKINDDKFSISDIPIVRFRFPIYTELELNFIKLCKEKFSKSACLVEVQYDDNVVNNINILSDIEEDVAMYLYINVLDETMNADYSTIELPSEVEDFDWDRIMLKDLTTSLYTVRAEQLKFDIANLFDIEISDVGICGSPLSFGENACLTAVKARELLAMYCDSSDCPIPSANHQVGNCGCIRCLNIETDLLPTVIKSGSSNKQSSKRVGSGEKKESSPKKSNKKFLHAGMSQFRL